ncbi:D-alanine--poly(phosphoribitol) ligase subunit DltC [Loigolactobacillus coryniformis]|uniref:D-alanine--poly(phosphoribitol) ligase subunit DltC n=1 Tax=Loigolactobacillus coryniformis TaxID=1610 RepID=UPI00345CEA53
MSIQTTVLTILTDLTGTDFTQNLDVDLFADGLLDSMGTVQLLLELQDQLAIAVPVSEFERTQWNTPNKIIAQVEELS